MKKIIVFLFKIPFFIIKIVLCFFLTMLKYFFGYLFGWVPDLKQGMSGEEFEEYIQLLLMKNGYKQVTLTKKTGDYGIDILAKKKNIKYAFQCKLYQKPVGVAAIQQAAAGCIYYQCDRAIVVTNNTFTNQAYTLAMSNQVELWDGKKINQMKRKANSRSLFHLNKEEKHPYSDIIEFLLNKNEISEEEIIDALDLTPSKVKYILEDLEFYDLVSEKDKYDQRKILFDSYKEALKQLE